MTGHPVCDNMTDYVGHTRGLDLAQLLSSGILNNTTCLEHAPQLTSVTVSKVIVLAVIAVLSFVANVATICSIAINRQRRQTWSAIYTLILHLAVADLFVTVFCIGGEALWSYTVAWIFGNVACKLFKFVQVFSLYLSTFMLVLIGVDRYLAVRYPMKGFITPERCCKFVVFAWILSLVLATPQVRNSFVNMPARV